jgi:hypothetical protein
MISTHHSFSIIPLGIAWRFLLSEPVSQVFIREFQEVLDLRMYKMGGHLGQFGH